MSLNDLKLTPFLLKEMYGTTLIDSGTEKKEKPGAKAVKVVPKKESKSPAGNIKFLGNNNKHILILVNESSHAFVSDDELNFLMAILNACKISGDDAALVNAYSNDAVEYEKLNEQFSPEIILFLGTAPHELGFPVQIPRYRIQQYNNQQYIAAPSLKELSADKEEKKQLWNALKVLFSIG